jgi:hypothetical protein
MGSYTDKTEDLKKLAGLVRTYAERLDADKRKKTASLLVAATGLAILTEKLRG